MKWGIYLGEKRVWSNFTSEQQALDFIKTYDLKSDYTVKSYS